MKLYETLRRISQNEDINFLLTNRIPRNLLTRAMGRFSKIRNHMLCKFSIVVWRWFTDLDLSDALKPRFDSLHDCFTRQLLPGARALDMAPDVLVSPSDGIVGECGEVTRGQLLQAKGFSYALGDLLGSVREAERFMGGCYATLRLTSAMYHRFHAPHDLVVSGVDYIDGDTWNVNPIALKRVERLFCKNERAVIHARLSGSGYRVALVPVAAILVASIRLHFAGVLLHLGYGGPKHIPCHAKASKGQELGWFEHGSTIIVLAPKGFVLSERVVKGARLRMGSALMRVPPGPARA